LIRKRQKRNKILWIVWQFSAEKYDLIKNLSTEGKIAEFEENERLAKPRAVNIIRPAIKSQKNNSYLVR
jgi:hypothetical protein